MSKYLKIFIFTVLLIFSIYQFKNNHQLTEEINKLTVKYSEAEAKASNFENKYNTVTAKLKTGNDKTKNTLLSDKAAPVKKIKSNDSFTASNNGIIYDKKTKLEWFPAPDKNINWYDAVAWTKKLPTDGGRWRMPTVKELKRLYKKESGERNILAPFKTTGWYIWSSKLEGSFAWGFNFFLGSDFHDYRDESVSSRAFAVRLKK